MWIHPLGNMNIRTKLHDNQSFNVQLMGGESRGIELGTLWYPHELWPTLKIRSRANAKTWNYATFWRRCGFQKAFSVELLLQSTESLMLCWHQQHWEFFMRVDPIQSQRKNVNGCDWRKFFAGGANTAYYAMRKMCLFCFKLKYFNFGLPLLRIFATLLVWTLWIKDTFMLCYVWIHVIFSSLQNCNRI